MSRPFALLISWTCYGTWLPGDRRGHVSDVVAPDGNRIPGNTTPGTPVMPPDEYTRARAMALMKHPPIYLDPDQAECVARALIDAVKRRGWRLCRAAIMANHCHILVMDCPDDGPAVRRVLKGTTQAALTDQAGRSMNWWTAGGSDRYKHGHAAIEAADKYVAEQPYKLAEIDNEGRIIVHRDVRPSEPPA